MTNSKVVKAIRVSILLGDIPLDVYQLPDGSYRLAGKQVTDTIDEPNNSLYRFYGVKSLKALPSKGLESIQSIKTNEGGSFIPVDIDTATHYWLGMAQKGNKKAFAITSACLAEAIERRADAAVGKKVSEDERNARLKLRANRLMARRQWTDILQQRHLDLFGIVPTPDQFKEWTVDANLVLFNKPHFKCDRDTMSQNEQLIIEQFEFMCCRMANKYPSDTPSELLKKTLSSF